MCWGSLTSRCGLQQSEGSEGILWLRLSWAWAAHLYWHGFNRLFWAGLVPALIRRSCGFWHWKVCSGYQAPPFVGVQITYVDMVSVSSSCRFVPRTSICRSEWQSSWKPCCRDPALHFMRYSLLSCISLLNMELPSLQDFNIVWACLFLAVRQLVLSSWHPNYVILLQVVL